MFRKSLWGIALATVAAAGLLLTPDISMAQRRGGGGFRGGGAFRGGGGAWRGGGWGGGWRGGWRGGWGGYGLGFGLGYGLGYYAGYPYYGGYYDGWDYGTPYYYGSDYYQPSYTYVMPQQPTYVAPQSTYYGAYSQTPTNPNSAEITVNVPDPNAEIWVENYKTKQRGTVREFESAPLQPGQNYTFHIRARWNNNGQMVEQTREVQAQAGQQVVVNFDNNAPSAARTNEGASPPVPASNASQQ